jgi:type II secretory pathway component PulF
MIFIYEATSREGRIVRGEYEGASNDETVQYLIKRGLTPISVEALHSTGKGKSLLSIQFFDSIGPIDIMFLVRNLSATVTAGLSIVEALDILIADAEKASMKKILREVQALIKNGQTLSKGFETYAHLFPSIFMGMLRAGEMSGQLDKTLVELSKYLSKEYNLRAKVKSALMYPIILLVASSGVVAMLLMFVLPRLTKAFASSGVKLPWVTKFFLGLSNMLTYSFTLDLIVLGVLLYFFLYFRNTRIGKRLFFFILSRLPVAGDLIKKIALVRFARTFGNLLGSGISAVEALALSAASIGNQIYTNALTSVGVDIQNGMPISKALEKFPALFPRLLISLIIVGERTGTLHEILGTFSDFYEEEVDNKLKDLTVILEPILLLIMGLIVGAIAVSIILPIYQLVGNFV